MIILYWPDNKRVVFYNLNHKTKNYKTGNENKEVVNFFVEKTLEIFATTIINRCLHVNPSEQECRLRTFNGSRRFSNRIGRKFMVAILKVPVKELVITKGTEKKGQKRQINF